MVFWIIIRHMLGLTDNQLRTVMDTARQLPRLKFVALWGALTLTFAFPAQVFAAPEETITIATPRRSGAAWDTLTASERTSGHG